MIFVGIIKEMVKAFRGGFDNAATKGAERRIENRGSYVPPARGEIDKIFSMRELLYPEVLPSFQKLAADGHRDKRALAYAFRFIDPKRKRPVTPQDLDAGDFASEREAMQTLVNNGLAREVTCNEAMEYLYTVDAIKKLLRERGLPVGGNKACLIERLQNSGYKTDGRKYKNRLFRLTPSASELLEEMKADEADAISRAENALRSLDYKAAANVYRVFDKKWGFAHASGKRHTIFAHCDIPCSKFRFIENYPMIELHNTDDFKRDLRACLLAGLMRGSQNSVGLVIDFKRICGEKINCPGLLNLFDYDREVLQEMRKQIEFSGDNALEYYISHVLYLSREDSRANK